MPISGRFDADFASFYDACTKAEVSLRGFDAGTNQVEKSLNRMVDTFTGRRVISEATLMTEAITRIGSPARLTAAELQRVGAMADEAAEKLRRVGQDVPPKIQQVADAARRARGETDNLRGSFQQFDGVLAGLGINLGPQIRGIEDIASASGKTAGELGTLATAGLAVGAGVAGWGIGRAISGFFDLDKTIGDATAKLLGWGDVAAQEAAAGAEPLARASKAVGFAVHDMGTALIINSAAMRDAQAEAKKTQDAFVRMQAPTESAKALAKLHEELATLKGDGLLTSLQKDIESHAFSVAELADRYRVSTTAIQQFSQELQSTAAVHEKNAALLKKVDEDRLARQKRITEELAHLDADYEFRRVQADGTATEIIIANNKRVTADAIAELTRRGQLTNEIRDRLARNERQRNEQETLDQSALHTGRVKDLNDELDVALRTYTYMTEHANDFTRGALQAQLDKVRELQFGATAMGQAFAEAQDTARAHTQAATDALQTQMSTMGGGALFGNQGSKEKTVRTLSGEMLTPAEAKARFDMGGSFNVDTSTAAGRAQIPPDIKQWYDAGWSIEQAVRLATLMRNAGQGGLGAIGRDPLLAMGPQGGYRGGGGGSAATSPIPLVPPVIPLTAGTGGGTTVNVTMHVSGVFDLNAKKQLAAAVSDEILTRVKMGRQFGSA